MGSLDNPFNPISLAIGAEASFVARTMDSDRKHLQGVLRAAAAHPGAALVQIYQNCNIFNDGAFDLLKEPATRDDWTIRLEHGEPIRFGRDGVKAVVRDPVSGALSVAEDAAADDPRVVVHDAHNPDPSYAFALSRLSGSDLRYTPMGVFRSVERDTYDGLLNQQLDQARTAAEPDLGALLAGNDTWTVY
jgi:2-oxoglutarate ferredoxin oxidoreductase subunit beta